MNKNDIFMGENEISMQEKDLFMHGNEDFAPNLHG